MSTTSSRPKLPLRRATDEIGRQGDFYWRTMASVWSGRVLRYWKEVLRQAYALAISTGSVVLVVSLVFGFGLIIGVQAVYGARLVGAPTLAGAFTSVGNLREIVPYAFAYMMAAKVSTGFVAEIGTMSISDELDALDVMGFDSIAYLASTRLLASWLILPFVYAIAIAAAFVGSYIVVVLQIGQASGGGYLSLFWKYQNIGDYVFSGIKGMTMSTFVVLVGCYYGYNVRGGPAEVGIATARAMVVNLVGIHFIGLVTSQLFWGGNANLPIGG